MFVQNNFILQLDKCTNKMILINTFEESILNFLLHIEQSSKDEGTNLHNIYSKLVRPELNICVIFLDLKESGKHLFGTLQLFFRHCLCFCNWIIGFRLFLCPKTIIFIILFFFIIVHRLLFNLVLISDGISFLISCSSFFFVLSSSCPFCSSKLIHFLFVSLFLLLHRHTIIFGSSCSWHFGYRDTSHLHHHSSHVDYLNCARKNVKIERIGL